MKSGVTVAIFIAVAIIAAGSYFWFSNVVSDDMEPVYCATDVQECPDGSFVGRNSNNNCEFFACPATNVNNQTNGTHGDPTSAFPSIVNIAGFAFSPSTVTINVGDSVQWENKDSASHTVTSDSGSELDSPTLSKNGVYSHTFTKAGTFAYHCTLHPGMKGTVIVK